MNWGRPVGGGGLVGGSGFVGRSGLVGSRSGLVRSGSGLVGSRGGLVGSRGIRLGLILGIGGLALILHISHITVVVVSGISDSLDTAVGKVDLVRSGHGLAIGSFLKL